MFLGINSDTNYSFISYGNWADVISAIKPKPTFKVYPPGSAPSGEVCFRAACNSEEFKQRVRLDRRIGESISGVEGELRFWRYIIATAIKDLIDRNPKGLARVEIDRNKAREWFLNSERYTGTKSFVYTINMARVEHYKDTILRFVINEKTSELDLFAKFLMAKV